MSNISSFCFSYPGHTTRRRTILYPIYARSGIRTREANATDLKSVPFDRSGIRADTFFIFEFYLFYFVLFTYLYHPTSP